MTAAITRGLEIAIFNSCDGLGLARRLSKLHLPQLILMGEPVPDPVAQEFAKHFLTAYTGGKSLYIAFREVREKLQGIEDDYPCGSWLPVLFRRSTEVPPTWETLHGVKIKNRLLWGCIITEVLLLVGSFFGYQIIRILTDPPSVEDKISSGEEILIEESALYSKNRAVKLIAQCDQSLRSYLRIWQSESWEKWQNCFWTTTNYQDAFGLLRTSWLKHQKRDPETLIYLNNAKLEAKRVDYYTIAVVVPVLRNKDDNIESAEITRAVLRGVATAQTQLI